MWFPTITAHTGCDGSVPNTIASAIAGFALGADIVEVDVRTTADGVLVLAHDDLVGSRGGTARDPGDITPDRGEIAPVRGGVERIRGGEGGGAHDAGRDGRLSVSRSALADLNPVRRAGLAPTLDELFDAIPADGRVNLDLKDDLAVPLVVEFVARRGVNDRVHLTGCEAERARVALLLKPPFPVYLNTAFGTGAEGAAPNRETFRAECDLARETGCRGLNIAHGYCTPDLVAAARERGLAVSVWTVEPRDGFARFVDLAVDNITTRSVAAFVGFRASRVSRA